MAADERDVFLLSPTSLEMEPLIFIRKLSFSDLRLNKTVTPYSSVSSSSFIQLYIFSFSYVSIRKWLGVKSEVCIYLRGFLPCVGVKSEICI